MNDDKPGKADRMAPAIVLMYHGTPQRRPRSRYSLAAKLFQRHLDYLKRGEWKVLRLGELLEEESNVKRVAITFDDGYRDNYEGAFLPLMEHDMVATWFIVSGAVGGKAEWLPYRSEEVRLLSRSQVIEMDQEGMEIGSHCLNHPDLTELSEKARLTELADSKKILEDLLQKPVKGFAYPYGRWNSQIVKDVQEAGYSYACTTRSGWFRYDENPFLVRRVTVFSGDDERTLARKLAFAENDVSWLRMARYYGGRLRARMRA